MDTFMDLGAFQPTRWDLVVIETELRACLNPLKLIEVRPPDFPRYRGEDGFRQWHRDINGGLAHLGYWLVVWANLQPTDVKRDDTDVVMALEPGHIYRFRNELYHHKVPASVEFDGGRWFAKAYEAGH